MIIKNQIRTTSKRVFNGQYKYVTNANHTVVYILPIENQTNPIFSLKLVSFVLLYKKMWCKMTLYLKKSR